MKVCVIGTGYVGLVTGTCLADLGHKVICVDKDQEKIAKLNKGLTPIYEPGLEEIIKRNVQEKRLSFIMDIKEGIKEAVVIFIAVSTPPKEDGSADLSSVANVSRVIAESMDEYKVIVDKSTVPVKTGTKVAETIKRYLKKDVEFDVVSNPEFLREGSAIHDTMHPDRIVIGVQSKKAAEIIKELYLEIKAPLIETDIESAELIKHAANSFLALKISFANALANLCEKAGAKIDEVVEGMGLDQRIGRQFLNAGVGYGGSCFPKDVSAFIKIAETLGYDFNMLKEVEKINAEQKKIFIKKIEKVLWVVKDKKIAIWGLSFKPNTDDMRSAPAIDIIRALQVDGAIIKAYDPQAMENAKQELNKIELCDSPYQAAQDADAVVILTDWDEFKKVDLERIKKSLTHPIIIDGRNLFDPQEMKDKGFVYESIGRGKNGNN
ncbi:UDP-glucose dehydrogenase family protein [Candidatus Auribacterota bacterium]